MGKKKVALFYDENTESGKQILDFLTPFAKRKSDIVGELILFWISEHGTTVPVQWLDRSRAELGTAKPVFGIGAARKEKQEITVKQAEDRGAAAQKEASAPVGPGEEQDVSLIKAGLASLMQGGGIS